MTTHSKLDHALRHIVRRVHAPATTHEKDAKGPRVVPDRAALIARFFSRPELARHASRDGKLAVLVLTNDAARARKHIEHLGGEALGHQPARVFAARVPFEKLLEAADDPSVVRMQLGGERRPRLDLAHQHTELTNEAGERYFPAELGDGVLIGVIDTGIDVAHPTFGDGDKGSRIVAYWDQTTGEKYGEGFKPIGEAAAGSPDTNGHGTGVASVAAGNGSGSPDGALVGVAPRAKLAVVKSTFTDPDLVSALDWLVERADKLALPLVINMSLGGHDDGHDGYDLVSQHIDDISDKGRIVVVAAGNEGEFDIHAMHPFAATAPTWSFEFLPVLSRSDSDPSVRVGSITVTVWGNRHDILELTLEDPRGLVHDAPANVHDQVELDSAGYDGYWDKDRQSITNDVFHTISLEISSSDAELRKPWTVRAKLRTGAVVDPPVLVHAWITAEDQGSITAGASREYLIGSPGASRSAITAAAWTTRNEWVTAAAKIYKADGLEVGTLAGFSSPGPTRDGRNKPDLTAPGQWIGLAKSSRATAEPLYQIGQSSFMVERGTSFASPYIAGTTALLLAMDPTLSAPDVEQFLQGTVTAKLPARSWGVGKLDCKRLLQEATKLLRPTKRQASGA